MKRATALNKLKKKYCNCKNCPDLAKTRTQVVFGVGNPDKCKVVILGEAPGAKEDESGEPFVGRSGKFHLRNLPARLDGWG